MKKFLIAAKLCALSLLPTSCAHAAPVQEEVPVVILGGGVGAMTAATYLGRAGIQPIVITGPVPGGSIIQSHSVQNWPGELEISGVDLMEKMQKQAEANGAILRSEVVTNVDFSKRPFVITTKGMFSNDVKEIRARSCIIALGAVPNLLGVPGENSYWSKGVYNCAVCDGALFKDKVVTIVGGGDSALTEAHYLSNIAKKVYVLVRGSKFKTVDEQRKKEILGLANVEVVYNTTVQEVMGDGQKVTHLLVQKENGKEKEQLSTDALFLAIGAKPNTDLFKGQLALDDKGYITLKKQTETSVKGVFAIGDVVDPDFKQAITAAGDGARASLQIQKALLSSSTQQAEATVKQKATMKGGLNIPEIVTDSDLQQELQSSDGPIFLYFFSSRCVPCRSFAPLYQSWASEFAGQIRFLKANVGGAYELASRYNVMAVPTLLILDKDGNVVRRALGIRDLTEVGLVLDQFRGTGSVDLTAFK